MKYFDLSEYAYNHGSDKRNRQALINKKFVNTYQDNALNMNDAMRNFP